MTLGVVASALPCNGCADGAFFALALVRCHRQGSISAKQTSPAGQATSGCYQSGCTERHDMSKRLILLTQRSGLR